VGSTSIMGQLFHPYGSTVVDGRPRGDLAITGGCRPPPRPLRLSASSHTLLRPSATSDSLQKRSRVFSLEHYLTSRTLLWAG